jgi:hypothetical protein
VKPKAIGCKAGKGFFIRWWNMTNSKVDIKEFQESLKNLDDGYWNFNDLCNIGISDLKAIRDFIKEKDERSSGIVDSSLPAERAINDCITLLNKELVFLQNKHIKKTFRLKYVYGYKPYLSKGILKHRVLTRQFIIKNNNDKKILLNEIKRVTAIFEEKKAGIDALKKEAAQWFIRFLYIDFFLAVKVTGSLPVNEQTILFGITKKIDEFLVKPNLKKLDFVRMLMAEYKEYQKFHTNPITYLRKLLLKLTMLSSLYNNDSHEIIIKKIQSMISKYNLLW